MKDADFTDEKRKKLPDDAEVEPGPSLRNRRSFPRYEAEGCVEFHRPQERNVHTGALVNISKGGLAFFTRVSLAVGENLLLSYEQQGEPKSAEATVETVHSHPRDEEYLVGVKFIRSG